MTDVKIASVQPRSHGGSDEEKNVDVACKYIDEARKLDAEIVCFPEGYPGPFTGPVNYSAEKKLCAAAKRNRIYVIAGMLEAAGDSDAYYTREYLIAPSGDVVGEYRRVTSAGPQCYDYLGMGDKDLAWGDQVPVFETEHGNIGILCCSEIYTPELPRVLALKGADIVFMPVGGKLWTFSETWRTLVWARAIENIFYTAVSCHMFGREEGIGTIAGPEEVLAESRKEGIITATLDIDRLEWLRENDCPYDWSTVNTVPARSSGLCFYEYEGVEISRRPELYAPLTMSRAELAEISARPELHEGNGTVGVEDALSEEMKVR
jgi:predicted amidohydrolase